MADEAQEKSLLDKILSDGKLARKEEQEAYAKDLVGEFVKQVLDAGDTASSDVEAFLVGRIADLDRLITAQLNEIMHAEDFQKMESSWRGLHFLVMNTETGTQLKLRLMNITKKELLTDLQKAVEFDQSALFKKIYEEEYGLTAASLVTSISPGIRRIWRCWN